MLYIFKAGDLDLDDTRHRTEKMLETKPEVMLEDLIGRNDFNQVPNHLLC